MKIDLNGLQRARARSIGVASALMFALATGGWFMQRGARNGQRSSLEGARLFENVLRHVENDFVDSVAIPDLYRKAVDGLLYELGDPYTAFLAPDKLGKLSESTTGNYAGLGLQVEIRDNSVVVIAPLPGSPAERAGLMTGDRIVEVQGKSTQGWTLEDVSTVFRGKTGETVAMKVDRPGNLKPLPFTLTRRPIHLSAVRRASLLSNGVGYVDLKAFSDSTTREMSRAIDSLSRAGMHSLILDLRANPGGLLSQGVDVADLFLDGRQRIVSLRGRIPQANADFDDRATQKWPKLPVIVLVDSRSASASEIVAGALQDHDRAVVIGRPTYGKGSAQSLYQLGTAGGLKITTARWFTPAGRSINKWVVRDDSESAQDAEPEKQPFKTDAGRTVFGGGGITPDILAGDTATAPAIAALQSALGTHVSAFRDALTEYALLLKASGAIRDQNFPVTPEMREQLWKRMVARGIDMPKGVYEEAAPGIDTLLGYEIARFVFGPEGEFRRRAARDEPIVQALKLLAGSPAPREILDRAEAMQKTSQK
ncbi:MAG: S41 family peptidase [Gemmatimonadaceae bacterium]|nr:S41 family peptidase [Gemmatimonadaceae bacterium]